jgi:hypothetical protein
MLTTPLVIVWRPRGPEFEASLVRRHCRAFLGSGRLRLAFAKDDNAEQFSGARHADRLPTPGLPLRTEPLTWL